jgi:hypothetical protein
MYQRGNRKASFEGHTIQWSKEKGQIMIYQTLDRKLEIGQHEI